MEDSSLFKYSKEVLLVPLLVLIAIWLVFGIETGFDLNFSPYGILPKAWKGLRGIFFGPFIHSSLSHLFNNSIPLGVLLSFLFFFYKKMAYKVLIVGTLLTGLLTWSFARTSYHIGASGVVYMLFSFIFFSGVFRKHYRLIALSLVVIFLYGGMVWYLFPIEEQISWEGHSSGFLIGLFLAVLYKRDGPQKKEFEFTQNEFDLMFDENGNFKPNQQQNNEGTDDPNNKA